MNRNKNRIKKLSTLCALAISSSFLFGGVALADYNPDQATTINLFSEGLSLGVAAHEGNPAEIFIGSMEIMNQLSKVPGLGFLSDITGGEPTSLGEIAGMLETIEKQLGDMKIQLSDIQQTVDQIEDTQVTSLFDAKEQAYSKVLNVDIQPSYDELKGLAFKGVKTYTTLSQALSAKDYWFLFGISTLYNEDGIYESNLNNLSTNVYQISDDGTDLKSDTISKMMENLQKIYGYQFNHLEAGDNAVPLFTKYNKDVTGIYINILEGLQKAYTVESAIIRINMAIKDYNDNHSPIVPITPINLTLPPNALSSSDTPDTEQDLMIVRSYFKTRVALLKAQFTKSVNDGGYLIPNVDFRLGRGDTVMYYRNSYVPNTASGKTGASNGEIYLASIKGYQDYKKSMWNLVINPDGDENSAHWIYGSQELPEQISGEQTDFSEDHSPMVNQIMDANAMAEGHSNAEKYSCDENQTSNNCQPYWIRKFDNPYYLYISRDYKGSLVSFGRYSSRVWKNPQYGSKYAVPTDDVNLNNKAWKFFPAKANMLSLVPLVYANNTDDAQATILKDCDAQNGSCFSELEQFTKADLIKRYLNIFNHLTVAPSTSQRLDQTSNSVTYTSAHLSPGSMTQPLTVKYQTPPDKTDKTDKDAQLYLLQGGMEYIPGSSAWGYKGNVFQETYTPRLVMNPNPKNNNDVTSAMVPADIMSSESTYKPGKTLWYLTMPKSDHLAGNYLQMQTDGNLVEYSKEGDNGYQALWSSAKSAGYSTGSGQPGVLTIQSDGNVVVYHNNGTAKNPALGIPLWSTGRPCTGINSMDPDSCKISSAVNK